MPMMADVDDLEDNVQGSPFSRDQNCRHSSRSRESPGSRQAGQLNIITTIMVIITINIIVFQLLTRIKNHHNHYHYCRHHSHHQIILAGSIEMLQWHDQSFHWKIKVRHHFLHNGCHHLSPPFVASFTPTQLLLHPLVAINIFYIFVNLCTCLKKIILHNDLSLPAMQALTFFYGLGTDGYWGSVY